MDFYACRLVQLSDLSKEVPCLDSGQRTVKTESPLFKIESSLLAEELLTVGSFLGRESQFLLVIMVPVRLTMFHWRAPHICHYGYHCLDSVDYLKDEAGMELGSKPGKAGNGLEEVEKIAININWKHVWKISENKDTLLKNNKVLKDWPRMR